MRQIIHASLLASLLCGAATSALAQETPAATSAGDHGANTQSIEELVVTARRRAESLQEVPLAVSVISAARVEDAGAFTVGRLQQIAPTF